MQGVKTVEPMEHGEYAGDTIGYYSEHDTEAEMVDDFNKDFK
jgi:hypothetical protein